MKFFRQIKSEIKNILKSKFLLIFGILILAAGVLIPIIGLFNKTDNGSSGPTVVYGARDMAYSSYKIGYPGNINQDSITVNGIEIFSNNPFYWNLSSLIQEKDGTGKDPGRFSTPQALDLLLEVIDVEIGYYLRFAEHVTVNTDYRVELAWRGIETVYDKFFYEKTDVPEAVLLEVATYRKGLDPETFRKKYVQITSAERQAAIIRTDDYLAMIFDIVENSNFPKYIDLRLKMENDQIKTLQDNIAIQEQAIIDNPAQEESLNAIIEDLRRQIKLIETNNIPILQYRLAKNIRPGEAVWQNAALSDIENSRNQLVYLVIMSEEDFNKNNGGGYMEKFAPVYNQGNTYQEYVANMQRQIDQLNTTIIIAQKSLDSNKPDMKYVTGGARIKTVQFLDYSLIIALFGVLLGGWLIASEFQQGTIRLLMIRPKTRTKILLAKFLAALLVCLFADVAGSLLNLITNGICFGFTDFTFPNYSITGETAFLVYYLPKFLICISPVLFAFAMAFMLSVVVRNIAVAIAIPIVLFIGSFISMTIFAYSNTMAWLAWTPIPFIQISSFFQQYSNVKMIIQNGVPLSLTYGVTLLLGLSAICTLVSVAVFKKRDIAN